MIVHKEDAGEMWCPHARVKTTAIDDADHEEVTVNRDYNGSGSYITRCLGPECMAWRWARVRNPEWKQTPINMAMVTPSHPDDIPSPWIKSETHGYCGLAGAL